MKNIIRYLDGVIYWSMILLPFSIAVAPAPMNVLMGVLIASFLVKKILRKEPLFMRTALNMPLFFLFIITCLSIAHSIDLRDTIKGGILRMLQYIFIFFITAEELKDKRHIGRVLLSLGLGVFLASFDAVWQVATGRDFIRGYAPIINLGIRRATASFKDANTFGIYLSTIAPVIFGLTLFYFKGLKKMGMFFLSIIGLTGIVLTYSRPTFLAIYAAFFLLAIARKNKPIIIFLLILTVIAPFIAPKAVKEWARQVEYHPIRFMCNDDRIAIYQNSLNMIKAHPLIGLGANTYMKNYRFYKNVPEYRQVVTSDYIYAHNNFLHLAAELGLIGLGIFLWLLCKLFRECLHIYRRLSDAYLRIISLSLSASLAVFLINGLTESSLYSSRVAMVFWYLAGFALGLAKFSDANRPQHG